MKASNSIYLKLVVAGCLAAIPAGTIILYQDQARLNRLIDQQLEENLKHVGAQILAELPSAGDLDTRFEQETQKVLSRFNSAASAGRIAQGSLYKKGDGENIYRLTQNVLADKASSVPLLSTNVFKENEFSDLRRIDDLRYQFTLPFPSARNPDYVLSLQAIDEGRPAYLQGTVVRNAVFWGLTFLAILCFTAFVVHSEVKIPLKHLRAAFSQKRKTALDPDDFGEFAELVKTIEEFRHARDESSDDQFLDSDTGLPTEIAAQKIFEDARASREENYVAFFRVNYAREYIKLFGRANRRIIKKIVADVLEACLPPNTVRAVTEEYFFICGLSPKDFKRVVEKCRHKFNEDILKLYDLGQGKQVAIQTLSAFAISNRTPDIENFTQAQDLVRTHWETVTDMHNGSWAVLTQSGQVETAKGFLAVKIQALADDAPPKQHHIQTTEKGDVVGLTSPGLARDDDANDPDRMDPTMARKMFIVKLARLAGIKPRLAAQVYSAGWQRPDLLLQSKIQEISSKAGLETQEASDLIANLRKHPKEKLAYELEDYREVFLTDVRIMRKIPRESLSRWFDAGYRRIEDLRAAATDDLVKLDDTVLKEDIESVLAGVKAAARIAGSVPPAPQVPTSPTSAGV